MGAFYKVPGKLCPHTCCPARSGWSSRRQRPGLESQPRRVAAEAQRQDLCLYAVSAGLCCEGHGALTSRAGRCQYGARGAWAAAMRTGSPGGLMRAAAPGRTANSFPPVGFAPARVGAGVSS